MTNAGSRTLKSRLERIEEVDSEWGKIGVEVLKQYIVFREYDFVTIAEAKDNLTVMKAMVELTSRGTVKTVTLPAIEVDEFISRWVNNPLFYFILFKFRDFSF